ncbi:unnamed protein product [Vitrella brassicaformis CCMP3155]|uniref:Uncharacterized protein n=1 Tax=Vitrella brassicaformis (strain CCMP3155) TaxID=1169540 RepID=A0A0G4FNF0_VITBC|nr:unnamed protein product [Vitrella brassicaformis CCMP3155]|eukprot:CEM15774.1 unnamed protein product [Vitrella brassicaformis CCMP3155]
MLTQLPSLRGASSSTDEAELDRDTRPGSDMDKIKQAAGLEILQMRLDLSRWRSEPPPTGSALRERGESTLSPKAPLQTTMTSTQPGASSGGGTPESPTVSQGNGTPSTAANMIPPTHLRPRADGVQSHSTVIQPPDKAANPRVSLPESESMPTSPQINMGKRDSITMKSGGIMSPSKAPFPVPAPPTNPHAHRLSISSPPIRDALAGSGFGMGGGPLLASAGAVPGGRIDESDPETQADRKVSTPPPPSYPALATEKSVSAGSVPLPKSDDRDEYTDEEGGAGGAVYHADLQPDMVPDQAPSRSQPTPPSSTQQEDKSEGEEEPSPPPPLSPTPSPAQQYRDRDRDRGTLGSPEAPATQDGEEHLGDEAAEDTIVAREGLGAFTSSPLSPPVRREAPMAAVPPPERADEEKDEKWAARSTSTEGLKEGRDKQRQQQPEEAAAPTDREDVPAGRPDVSKLRVVDTTQAVPAASPQTVKGISPVSRSHDTLPPLPPSTPPESIVLPLTHASAAIRADVAESAPDGAPSVDSSPIAAADRAVVDRQIDTFMQMVAHQREEAHERGGEQPPAEEDATPVSAASAAPLSPVVTPAGQLPPLQHPDQHKRPSSAGESPSTSLNTPPTASPTATAPTRPSPPPSCSKVLEMAAFSRGKGREDECEDAWFMSAATGAVMAWAASRRTSATAARRSPAT